MAAQTLAAGAGLRAAASGGSGGRPAAVAALPCPPRRPSVLRLNSSSSSMFSGSAVGSSSSSSSSGKSRRSAAPPPRAAAAGAAAGDSASPQQPAKPQIKREMSMQQRWRAFQFALKEGLQRLSQTPAAAALLASLAAANARLEPLYAVLAALQRQWQDLIQLYNAFCAEETKRAWAWGHRNEKEVELWMQLPQFTLIFVCALAYQALMPVSFALTVAAPLYYAWVVWDDWWRSPLFLATLLMLPLKWVPWADACLLWPGLI